MTGHEIATSLELAGRREVALSQQKYHSITHIQKLPDKLFCIDWVQRLVDGIPLALVGGKVSSNLECFDVDDPISKKLKKHLFHIFKQPDNFTIFTLFMFVG
jgi:hypothetical protein